MAYNNKNKLIRVKQIQDAYLLHKKDGVSTRYVYKTFIWPRWNISISSLYNYLAINVRKEMRQLDMFDHIN